jgi:dienelactone hydrolase
MKIFAPLLLCTLLGASPSLGMKQISVEPLEYTDVDGFLLEGYKSMPVMDNMPEKVPAVVIIPDWDGVNSYEQQRSTLIAELGYVGFAADIYGISDHFVEDMGRRRELVTLYRSNVTLFVQRIKAAVNLVKTLDGVDPDNVAVIGYCFGGTGVLVSILSRSTSFTNARMV